MQQRKPRSGLPIRTRSTVEVARGIYTLETRRRNLQIRQHVLQQKLASIDAQLQDIDKQLAELRQLALEQLDPPNREAEADYDRTDFDLQY